MNYRTFKNILNFKPPGSVEIEIIKNAQIRGHHNEFLANRTNHPNCSYPITPDTTKHLHPGQRFKVLSIHPPNTIYGPSCLKVTNSIHTFYIFQTDFKKFIKLVQ